MPTIFTHAVVPLAAAVALGGQRLPWRLTAVAMAAAVLPDLDTIAFAFGIPYADDFGHRGASHSLVFAILVGLCAMVFATSLRRSPMTVFCSVAIACASHPLLDAFTSGGLGVALFWPFDATRHFAPWRPILVSPIGAGFFSARGLSVLLSEMQWVWLPAIGLACFGRWLGGRARIAP